VALATLIVLGALALVLAIPQHRAAPPREPYVSRPATPRAGGPDPGRRRDDAVSGEAPWALSVVPECFEQTRSFSGDARFARAHIPPGARRVAAGLRLRVADCTLDVAAETAELRRGDNRLDVPAPAHFFVAGPLLVLDQREGVREEVRLYALRGGAAPAFVPSR
jgi:hypothetical protein